MCSDGQAHLQDDVERLKRELVGAYELAAEDQRLFEQVEEEFLADTRRLDGRVNDLADALKAVLALFTPDSRSVYLMAEGRKVADVVRAARRTLEETEQPHV